MHTDIHNITIEIHLDYCCNHSIALSMNSKVTVYTMRREKEMKYNVEKNQANQCLKTAHTCSNIAIFLVSFSLCPVCFMHWFPNIQELFHIVLILAHSNTLYSFAYNHGKERKEGLKKATLQILQPFGN